eukprot:TRINITY_DN4210_c0_g1_i2.p1 TRINITY_DN4210_c0_g1~~TRINITY_DN4210_c0_g1_i2.p1  ORF type:complete len:820 (+),score=192.17 TRINITY_DN4210_c0_g1_i2:941-3400(+)
MITSRRNLVKETVESLRQSYTKLSTSPKPDDDCPVLVETETKIIGEWNTRFQQCITGMNHISPHTLEPEKCAIMQQLMNLAQDFIYAATTFGKIIISELYLPVEQKTIKPRLSAGGVAGGLKYFVHNIMFKFACDDKKMYGSEEAAAKVAGHELKGCISYFNCVTRWVRDITVPLMALVDYRGFRLVAMTELPTISKATLRYGSSDGGKTVVTSDPVLNDKLKRVSQILNIRRRRVREGAYLYSPVDLEGHKGSDAQYYLVDFSRCFPPEFPDKSIPVGHLFRLLRPEFVRYYPKQLCPDACTGFIKQFKHADEFNKDIAEATQFLRETLVPNVGEELQHIVGTFTSPEQLGQFRLVQHIHRRGVNMRYLGHIRQNVQDATCRGLLLVEVLARVSTCLLKMQMRDKHEELCAVAVDQPFWYLVVSFFNVLLGNSQESHEFWNEKLVHVILYKFAGALSESETRPGALRQELDSFLPCKRANVFLVRRIENLSGIKFRKSFHEEMWHNPDKWECEMPFSFIDLKRIGERVKHMNIISFSLGYLLKSEGEALLRNHRSVFVKDEAHKLFVMALEKFEEALDTLPGNSSVLALCGELLVDMALLQSPTNVTRLPKDNPYIVRARAYFKQVKRSVDVVEPAALLSYAQFQHKCGYNNAQKYFLKALETDPNDVRCLYEYAVYLRDKNPVAAKEFYSRYVANLQAVAAGQKPRSLDEAAETTVAASGEKPKTAAEARREQKEQKRQWKRQHKAERHEQKQRRRDEKQRRRTLKEHAVGTPRTAQLERSLSEHPLSVPTTHSNLRHSAISKGKDKEDDEWDSETE